MDSKLEDVAGEATLEIESSQSGGRNKADCGKKEEINKKSRPGNNPGRVKRVLSSKRKTRRLVAARKKPQGPGKAHDAAKKGHQVTGAQDARQHLIDMDANRNHDARRTTSQQDELLKLDELTRDHSAITEVLLGRNLRLKLASTLWRRHFGELITYFLRIQDASVFVDMLPLISQRVDEDAPNITIGCCVDLFPLVQQLLTSPYEKYVTVGLMWISSVLKRWWGQLTASGCTGSTDSSLDKNFPVFNQQLLELWHQEPELKSFPGAAGDTAKALLLLLSLFGVDVEHLQAENLHLLPSDRRNEVMNLGMRVLPRDCHEMLTSSSGHARDGVYLIQPGDAPVVAYCAMREGGWTIVQHITVNSSVNFDRQWADYKRGFGDVTGDHWLGNEYLHQLSRGPPRFKLGVKLVDWDAVTKTGEYDPFLVEDESSAYRLRLGLFRGTAVDALTRDTDNYLHDNQKFTTKDRDNDNYFQNCAELEFQGVAGGGWWYDACAGANLNRRNVIYWQKDCNKERLCKYAWMMVKPSDSVKNVHCGKDEL
ncbi:uncharacterized protein zgc:194887 [Syngnathoides biaculeatus]|uniref:uncharacterized protein zgc:194887 n=1 Tax=Syngnathoides biaculeatus TaxID=300417 RepID=UPI002ADDE284|nr:uncharacterized protein zgc:194887 [Syngnathoides biaculeatus]XP_061699859.1 uncharacterized protein zgc:194887 [Syngnathoides biaculeatus]XP_061699860.1 uncharacterized protein zgc:194887 [Syngnathoides biaculeatus]